MPFDGVVARFLSRELNENLEGARVDKIVQPTRRRLDLLLRRDRTTYRLAIDTNPESPYLTLTSEAPQNLPSAPSFLMLLRKHLTGARLESIFADDYERVIRLRFSVRNEMGDLTTKDLVAELMGRYANLILLNRDGVIHDALRHVDASVNRRREVLPAHPYVGPPPQDKRTPDDIASPQDAEALLSRLSPALTTKEAVFRSLAGVSPLLAAEAAAAAGLGGAERLGELDDGQKGLFVYGLLALCRRIADGRGEPAVFYRDDTLSEPIDYHALLLRSQAHASPAASLAEAIDLVESARAKRRRLDEAKRALLRAVTKQLNRCRKKAAIHAADVESGRTAERWKEKGELIYANLWRLGPGVDRFLAEPFDGGSPFEIELDLRRSPAGNAEQCFRRYRKEKTRHEEASRRLEEDLAEIAYLQSLAFAAESAVDELDLAAVRNELYGEQGGRGREDRRRGGNQHPRDLLPGRPAGKKRKQKQFQQKAKKKTAGRREPVDTPIGYRTYVSSDGFLLRAGRNNLQNDRLTFRDSAAGDLWLHARLAAGSHVVVKTEGKAVPDSTLLEAAALAAHFSEHNRAGGGAAVDIDYTEIRHVKKPPRSKPGFVTYDQFKTIRVRPALPKTPGSSAQL